MGMTEHDPSLEDMQPSSEWTSLLARACPTPEMGISTHAPQLPWLKPQGYACFLSWCRLTFVSKLINTGSAPSHNLTLCQAIGVNLPISLGFNT